MKIYAIVTTLLTLMGLVGLFSLRVLGLYSHQALAVVAVARLHLGGREPRLAGVERASAPGAAARTGQARASAPTPASGRVGPQ